MRPALKNLLTTVAGRNDLLALVAPASSITIAGELPGTGPQLAAAVDRIAGHRVEENPLLPVLDAEAIAILRGDLESKSARRTAVRAAESDDVGRAGGGSRDRAIG